MTGLSTTVDGILDRRVLLEQPESGYRVAIDTVLLAAAVPAIAGDRILDLGCGVGGTMLALAARVVGLTGLGLEIQQPLVDLCAKNIAGNACGTGFAVRLADVRMLPLDLVGCFDHVLMNPPYHEEKRHDASSNDIRHIANIEKNGDLPLWIAAAATALKPSGSVTIIHRADRCDEIVSLLGKAFGDAQVLPLFPKAGVAPKRMIFRARKNAVFSIRECRPLVLHSDGASFAPETEAILRHAGAMVFCDAE